MSDSSNPPQVHLNGNGADDNHSDPELNGTHEHDSNRPDSPSVVEIDSEEFPTYFEERGGRLFQSSPSPYPLPVDTPEQERLNLSHDLLLQLFGANYIGPVPDVLRDAQARKMALDLCTGTGKWVLEMAQAYPQTHFRGFDIVPIATRYPPSNVQFEIGDVNTNFRWNDGTFDLVNARTIGMAVRDYGQVVQEVARVLRPGGMFVSYEWAPYPAFDPSHHRDPSHYAPASCRFHDAVNQALLLHRGLHPIAAQIPSFLASAGVFTEISTGQHYVPIGAWPTDPHLLSIGTTCLEIIERYADSIKPLLLETGWTDALVESMLGDYIREVRTGETGMASILYTVHARKAQTSSL